MSDLSAQQEQELVERLAGASLTEKTRIIHELESAIQAQTKDDPAAHFPMHAQQEKFRRCSADVNLMIGGNRSGKTTTAKLIIADVIRRRSPINDRLTLDTVTGLPTRSKYRPLEIWVGVPTIPKFMSDWIRPADPTIGLRHFLGDQWKGVTGNKDNIEVRSKRGDKIIPKSYEQGLLQFEMSEVDLVILDEEPPDAQVVNSCRMRVATSNGVIIMVFTPLEGLTWTWKKYYKPIVEHSRGKLLSDREWLYEPPQGDSTYIVNTGMADNPRARDAAVRIEADQGMLPSEKAARLYGTYGYTEGVFLPRLAGLDILKPADEHEVYVVDTLPRIARWMVVADPNYRTGAVLAAVDGDFNIFLCKQHLEEDWVTHQHADVFRKWLEIAPSAQLFADMGAAGKYATCELHNEGLAFQPVQKGADSVPRSIKTLRNWTIPDPSHVHPVTGERGAPRLYFYRPWLMEQYELEGQKVWGSRLLDQLGSARQTDQDHARPETPHKTQKNSLDLWDCARYIALLAQPVQMDDDRRSDRPLHKVQDRLPTSAELAAARNTFDPANPTFEDPPWMTGKW